MMKGLECVDVSVWTHGSVGRDTRDGGMGVLWRLPGGFESSESAVTGAFCTNFQAEMLGVDLALRELVT